MTVQSFQNNFQKMLVQEVKYWLNPSSTLGVTHFWLCMFETPALLSLKDASPYNKGNSLKNIGGNGFLQIFP